MLQSNATLRSITADGVEEDWTETPAGAGASKWAGRARAYYTEKRERQTAAGVTDAVLRRTLVLEQEIARAIDLNDTLTFEYGGETLTGTAKLIERRDLGNASPLLRTTRIELENVAAVDAD